MTDLCIDLFCGIGGWAEGFLAEGYECIGFDIERHNYGTGGYPGQLVLQDVLTLHGRQFRNATVIVASPPCQAYSYRAMPWKRAKALPPPDNSLFEACFRIQLEACEAAGRFIPLIVENVKGAQPWVGRAAWHFGSFYLWGDVPALMPPATQVKISGQDWNRFKQNGKVSPHWRLQNKNASTPGGSWFNIAHGRVLPEKQPGNPIRGSGEPGVKQHGSGRIWFDTGIAHLPNNSARRKAASAMIAKIPFPLANHIARVFKPNITEDA